MDNSGDAVSDSQREPVLPGPNLAELITAFETLPIQARLEFVKNLVLMNGGDKNSLPDEPALVAATEILNGVLQILDANPQIAKLRAPEP